MNWEAIGAVGELAGAAAVVVTLVYLAAQVKANSTLTKATIREQRTTSSNAVIFAWMNHAEAFAKLQTGEELSTEESLTATLAHHAMFRDWEAYAYQHHIGVLDDSEWNAILANWGNTLKFPHVADHWKQFRGEFSPLLVSTIDELLK